MTVPDSPKVGPGRFSVKVHVPKTEFVHLTFQESSCNSAWHSLASTQVPTHSPACTHTPPSQPTTHSIRRLLATPTTTTTLLHRPRPLLPLLPSPRHLLTPSHPHHLHTKPPTRYSLHLPSQLWALHSAACRSAEAGLRSG